MRVPINWLDNYVKIPADVKLLTDKLTMVGHMLDKTDIVNGHVVLDLELRNNRADCYSIIGIARESAAVLNKKISYPEISKLPKLDNKLPLLKVMPEAVGLVKRYCAFKLSVKVQPSPKWMVDFLTEYGIPAINNVIDITNFVMVETGHPMHAFDFSKIKGGILFLRKARKNEEFKTIQQNTKFILSPDDFVVSDEQEVQCLNIIGGYESRVTTDTKEIILESAVYNPANCRRTARRLKTITEGGSRHEKHQDPNGVGFALERALYLLEKYADAKIMSSISDYYPKKLNSWKVGLNHEYLTQLGGVSIEPGVIKKILLSLGFEITKLDKKVVEVLVPTYRTDVMLPEDLAEEILRIYGYDNISPHVLSLEIPNEITPNYIKQENSLRESATAVGFNEAITLSFIKEDYKNLNVDPEKSLNRPAVLINPPSPDNKNLRMNLLPNLYEIARKSLYEREEEIRLFEIGKIYFAEKNKYYEKRKIAFVYFDVNNNSFSIFKSLIDSFFVKAGLPKPNFSNETYLLELKNSFSLSVNDRTVGFGGKYDDIFYTEVDLDSVLGLSKIYSVSLWPKYPPQIEDITFVFPDKTYIGNVINSIFPINRLIGKVGLKDVFKNAYTFRIEYQDPNKTLTDTDVEKIRKEIIALVKTKFGGSIRE